MGENCEKDNHEIGTNGDGYPICLVCFAKSNFKAGITKAKNDMIKFFNNNCKFYNA